MRKSIKILLIAVIAAAVLIAAYFVSILCFRRFGMPAFMFGHETNEGGGVTITSYRGFDTQVNIPDTIGGLPVTEIGSFAFSSENFAAGSTRKFNSKIAWVRIPDTVEAIDPGAFAYTSIAEIAFPASLKYVGSYAFVDTPLQSAALPEGTLTLAESAFSGAYALETAVLPESLERIGERAFEKCYSLRQINIPAGLRWMGKSAFAETALDEEFIKGVEEEFPGITLS